MIPISPPPLGFATEVSSSPEGQNIRRRITPSTPVLPLTCLLPLKPTTIIAEVSKPTPVFPKTRPLPLKPTTIIAELPKPTVTGQKPTPVAAVVTKAAVPEREESHEERMLKRYDEEREANDERVVKKFYEEMEAKRVRKPSSGGLSKSSTSRLPQSLGLPHSILCRPTPSNTKRIVTATHSGVGRGYI